MTITNYALTFAATMGIALMVIPSCHPEISKSSKMYSEIGGIRYQMSHPWENGICVREAYETLHNAAKELEERREIMMSQFHVKSEVRSLNKSALAGLIIATGSIVALGSNSRRRKK